MEEAKKAGRGEGREKADTENGTQCVGPKQLLLPVSQPGPLQLSGGSVKPGKQLAL